jgi:hypothetical protein
LQIPAATLALTIRFIASQGGGVPQVTEAQRVARIKQLLAELNKVPPERHEVLRLPDTAGEPRLCQVIKIGVDEVLLNHRSHRVRAQLEDDAEWKALGNDPHSEAAQKVIERYVTGARSADELAALKNSLEREGQTHPGAMTHKGVLINANTRVVALRRLEDPAKRYVRVAVLPETMHPDELALLELRLQMQKELKVDYTLTNELLFIEELSSERHLSDAQIARELRFFPESVRKGENEVRMRLQMLDLIHLLRRIPHEHLPLTFFDKLGYQQLRDLHGSYHAVVRSDPDEAHRHLEGFLLSVAVGVTPVHQLRRVDSNFLPDYMLPQPQDDEIIGEHAARLATATAADKSANPQGVSALLTNGDPDDGAINVRALIDVVTQRDKRVLVPGTPIILEREDVKDALKAAIITGINEKRRDESEADKLQAPLEALKNATRQLTRCAEVLRDVVHGDEFDEKHRKTFEVAFRKLKRTYRALEAELIKVQIIGK